MASRKLLKNTLSQNAHLQVNKRLIQTLGLTEAALVSLLIDSEMLHADDSGWFFLTADMAQHELNIGRKPYDAAIKVINDAGLMQTTLRGCPAKKFFKLNHDEIVRLLSDDDEDDEYKQGCPDGTIQFDPNGQTCMSETDNNKECSYNKNEKNKKEENNNYSKKEKKEGFDLSFVNINFESAFCMWLQHKHDIKDAYKTQQGIEICYQHLLEMSNHDPNIAQKIVEQAIANNWKGLYPLKQNNNGSSSTQTQQPRNRFCDLAASIKAAGGIL